MSIDKTLASIREKVEAGSFPVFKKFPYLGPNSREAHIPVPHVNDITDRDPWAERCDHPKD